jgi:hypothetical protein
MRSELNTWEEVAKVRARCEGQAAKEGLAGLELFFRSQNLFMEVVNAQPTYRQIQTEWRKEQERLHPPKPNPLIEALRQIADGHNDPRKLASDVLQDTLKEVYNDRR